MLAAVENVAILFEQEVATAGQGAAMVVAVEEELCIGWYSTLTSGSQPPHEAERHDKNLVSANSIGLDFEERERLGCARCRRD